MTTENPPNGNSKSYYDVRQNLAVFMPLCVDQFVQDDLRFSVALAFYQWRSILCYQPLLQRWSANEESFWNWANQRLMMSVVDTKKPIRDQWSGHVIISDQSEISIEVMWSVMTNQRSVFILTWNCLSTGSSTLHSTVHEYRPGHMKMAFYVSLTNMGVNWAFGFGTNC